MPPVFITKILMNRIKSKKNVKYTIFIFVLLFCCNCQQNNAYLSSLDLMDNIDFGNWRRDSIACEGYLGYRRL